MVEKSGYKRTEVGDIPEDWVVKPFGELFDFSGGFSASRDQLSDEGHCYLHYGDIHGATKTCVDTQADYQHLPKLKISLKKIAPRTLLKDGDVVFVDASEDDEGTSKHVVVVNRGNLPFISGLHTIVAKSKTNEITNEYKRYCFQTAEIRRQFLFYAVGTKVSGISKSNIPKLLLPFPEPTEQRAIATALSDFDALLEVLDRLIAKKRNLKQAAMQQLMTGETRLPGYDAEWVVKRLGDVAELNRKSVVPSSQPTQPFVHFSLPAFDDSKNAQVVLGSTIGSNKFEVPPNAVLLSKLNPRIPRIWAPKDIPENACASTEWLVLTPRGGTKREFLFMLCSSPGFCQQMALAATGTTGSHQRISPNTALDIRLAVPVDESEQTAIAAVLSDMDAEIGALEQCRAKTGYLKQAMMQELLTGRTRLIAPAHERTAAC